MTRKHPNIKQLDEDDNYIISIQYWKDGGLGRVYQIFLDVIDVIATEKINETDIKGKWYSYC